MYVHVHCDISGKKILMFPVRCYTCNTVLAHLHPEYEREFQSGAGHPTRLFERLRIHRMCCRRMFLSYVDLVTEQLSYPNMDTVLDDSGTVLRREAKDGHDVSCD